MKVALPPEVTPAWQRTLTQWQRDALVEVARGTYSGDRDHDRLSIVLTGYGFDIIGLRRVSCFDSDGREIPDAWALAWVNEVHPDAINHGDWEGKYGTRAVHHPRRAYDGMGEGRWGMKLRRRDRRFARRQRERHVRQQAQMRAELERHQRELAEWVGSPYSYPGYERITELQSLLEEDRRADDAEPSLP